MLGTVCLWRLNKEKYFLIGGNQYMFDNYYPVSTKINCCAQFVRDNFHITDYYYFFIPINELRHFNKGFKGFSSTITSNHDLFEDWLSILDSMEMPFEVLHDNSEYKDLLSKVGNIENITWPGKSIVVKLDTDKYISKYHAQIAWNILRYIYIGEDSKYKGIVETFYEILHKDLGLDLYQKISLAASIGPIVKQNVTGTNMPETKDYYQHVPTLPFKLITLNTLKERLTKLGNNNIGGVTFPFFEAVCDYKDYFKFKDLPKDHVRVSYLKEYDMKESEANKFKYHTNILYNTNQINKIIEAFNNDKGFDENNKLSYE